MKNLPKSSSRPKVLAVIPARAGSKRIPNKNIRKFAGQPLVVHTIEQALGCSFIDRVIVDTDSREIAAIARRAGVEAPYLRPKRLARDKAQVVDSLVHLLNKLKQDESYTPDYVVLLQTTSPLRELTDIEECWRMILKTGATSVLTVCPINPTVFNLTKDNGVVFVQSAKPQNTRTQDWSQAYAPNGCFVYIIKTSALMKEKKIITKDAKAVVCPRWRSIDLDVPEDWALAETIFENRDLIKKRIKKI